MLCKLKDYLMSVPWVYDNIRPLVVGGIDHVALARFCAVTETDRRWIWVWHRQNS